MNDTAVQAAMDAVRDCALVMMENAAYIQQELPRVEMTEALRSRTAEICESMVGTKHDVISELFAIDVLLESKADRSVVTSRIDRVIAWLREDISRMHQMVLDLRDDTRKNEDSALALVLLQESAVNIVNAFHRVTAASEALARE